MCSPIVYLYYCYCTFINLYVGFPFFYACSFICASSGSFVPYMDRQKLFWNLKSRHIVSRFYLIRHWWSPSVGRKFCHSTKCLILYHFVLCTWCCFTNHFRRLYIYIYIYTSRRLCNGTDKDATRNISTKCSINKWPSSVSFKIRLRL